MCSRKAKKSFFYCLVLEENEEVMFFVVMCSREMKNSWLLGVECSRDVRRSLLSGCDVLGKSCFFVQGDVFLIRLGRQEVSLG